MYPQPLKNMMKLLWMDVRTMQSRQSHYTTMYFRLISMRIFFFGYLVDRQAPSRYPSFIHTAHTDFSYFLIDPDLYPHKPVFDAQERRCLRSPFMQDPFLRSRNTDCPPYSVRGTGGRTTKIDPLKHRIKSK